MLSDSLVTRHAALITLSNASSARSVNEFTTRLACNVGVRRQHPDRFHARPTRAFQSGGRIFDDDAARGIDAQPIGGEQKRFGMRLAVDHVFGADDGIDQSIEVRGVDDGCPRSGAAQT